MTCPKVGKSTYNIRNVTFTQNVIQIKITCRWNPPSLPPKNTFLGNKPLYISSGHVHLNHTLFTRERKNNECRFHRPDQVFPCIYVT